MKQNKDSLYGGKAIHANWTTSRNASGYKLASRAMSNRASAWNDLPYAIDSLDWNFEPLSGGRKFVLRITPVRGFLTGTPRKSAAARTDGIASKRTYVALGDSYSAGLGAPGLESSDGCYRSLKAWAFKMQPGYNRRVHLLACSGAKISGQKGLGSVQNQVSPMKRAMAKVVGRPEVVTVTVGGNDVGFTDVVRRCILGNCTGREKAVQKSIGALQPKLLSLYKSIKSHAPYADIVAGGYPAVLEPTKVGPGAGCGRISGNERAMASRLAMSLNARIASAATDAKIWSVGQNVWDAFRGHNACSSDPWIQSLNGDLFGETFWAIDNKSFHPKEAGQLAYARVFSDRIITKAGAE